jgi:hypothetical protein
VARLTMPAVSMTAAALILLTACGGGGGDNGSDKIQGAETTSPSRTPSATPSATSPAVQRPVITFPAGAKNVFDVQHTGDPAKDAVLADNSQAVDSVDAAIMGGKNRTPAMEFYYSEVALRGAADFVQGYLDKGDTWVGTTRYFDRKVTLRNDGSAVLIYCSDETKSFLKKRKTGKVTNAAGSADDYVLYNARLQKNSQGVWITLSLLSNRGAKECQP